MLVLHIGIHWANDQTGIKMKKKGIKQETVKIVHIFIYDNMEPIHSFLPGETRVLTYQSPNPAKPVNK